MKITVYSTKTCPYCVMLKKWLDEKGVSYVNYNVDDNPYAAQAMMSLSGQMGVPFSTVEYDTNTIPMRKITGFDKASFESALAAK